MTDKYVEELPASGALTGTEKLYAYDGLADRYVTAQQLSDLANKKTARVVTASGSVTITGTDALVVIAKSVGAATTVNLPAVASAYPGGTIIVDGNGDAATNNITVVPNGAEKIIGQSSYVIDSNRASICVRPIGVVGNEWIIT